MVNPNLDDLSQTEIDQLIQEYCILLSNGEITDRNFRYKLSSLGLNPKEIEDRFVAVTGEYEEYKDGTE